MSMMVSGPGRAYYSGDPGLFSRIGGALKGAAAGFVAGGPAGAIAGGVGGALTAGGEDRRPQALPGGIPTWAGVSAADLRNRARSFATPPQQRGPVIPWPGPGGLRVDPTAILPGGRPLATRTLEAPEAGMKLACPSGYHPNKSDYFLKDGTFVPKGSRCVKNRRRNPLNPRALDRAMSRIGSAKKAAKMLGRVTIRSKKTC